MLDRVKLALTVVSFFSSVPDLDLNMCMTSKRQMHFNLEWKSYTCQNSGRAQLRKIHHSTTGRPGEIKSKTVRHHWATEQACIATLKYT